METIVDIYELTGDNTDRNYKLVYESVKIWIIPASNEAIALYDNLPQGQTFSFRIISDDVPNIAEQAKFVVIDSQWSGFTEDDAFITVTQTKRQHIAGRNYLSGLCYKAT